MFVSKVLFVFVNFQLLSNPKMRLNSKLETISNLKKIKFDKFVAK
jgi:hypothetical protein